VKEFFLISGKYYPLPSETDKTIPKEGWNLNGILAEHHNPSPVIVFFDWNFSGIAQAGRGSFGFGTKTENSLKKWVFTNFYIAKYTYPCQCTRLFSHQ